MKPDELKLSHEYLLEILEYFPDRGKFVWKVNPRNRICVGKEAGSKKKSDNRYYIMINKTSYLRSRLAWFYTHGVWPKNDIDHRNRIKDDDKIENLREATRQENTWNRVYKNKKHNLPRCILMNGKKFQVRVIHETKDKYLGLFANLDEAIKCRDEFEFIHRKFLYL